MGDENTTPGAVPSSAKMLAEIRATIDDPRWEEGFRQLIGELDIGTLAMVEARATEALQRLAQGEDVEVILAEERQRLAQGDEENRG